MMERKLSDMSLEELWRLFPVSLVAHRHEWSEWAKEEMDMLCMMLGEMDFKIHHIGSTSIPGIQAKPIIDILVETDLRRQSDKIVSVLEKAGYILMSRSETRMSFNKGYTPVGYAERVSHVHFHLPDDNDEILFRDYLCANPDVAKEYESLKLSLLPKYRHDRDGYTEAKSDFIRRVLEVARR